MEAHYKGLFFNLIGAAPPKNSLWEILAGAAGL
jgi:hypothetical protein